jgi:phosphatidylglycerophosphate synthase
LGHVAPDVYSYLLPPSVAPLLGIVAQLGVILYMFVGKVSMPPSWLGKWTTCFQIATVLLGMLDNLVPSLRVAVMPCAVITTALTIGSGLDYVYRGTRLLNDQ